MRHCTDETQAQRQPLGSWGISTSAAPDAEDRERVSRRFGTGRLLARNYFTLQGKFTVLRRHCLDVHGAGSFRSFEAAGSANHPPDAVIQEPGFSIRAGDKCGLNLPLNRDLVAAGQFAHEVTSRRAVHAGTDVVHSVLGELSTIESTCPRRFALTANKEDEVLLGGREVYIDLFLRAHDHLNRKRLGPRAPRKQNAAYYRSHLRLTLHHAPPVQSR